MKSKFTALVWILFFIKVFSQNESSIYFDGIDDYLETPTSISYENIVDSISICSWIKLLSIPADGTATIISRRDFIGNPTGERHHLQLFVNNDLSISFSSMNNQNNDLYTTQLSTSANAIVLNEWTHVAVTFRNGILKLYRNGKTF